MSGERVMARARAEVHRLLKDDEYTKESLRRGEVRDCNGGNFRTMLEH